MTLYWPPSWAATVPRPGPALYRTPLWAQAPTHKFCHVSSYMLDVFHWLSEDFVPYNCFSLAFPSGPRFDLSSRTLLHYPWCFGSSSRRSPSSTERDFLIVPFARTPTKQIVYRSTKVDYVSWSEAQLASSCQWGGSVLCIRWRTGSQRRTHNT